MAHTNSTPNYNLPQFLGTDKPAWLTDVNNAMSDIDTAIAAAKTTADTADTAVSALAITVGNHTSQLSTLSGAVTSQGNTLNTVTSLIGNGTPTTTDQTIIGGLNEINAAYKPKSDFAVVTATLPASVSDSVNIPYPDGFDVSNSVFLGGALVLANGDKITYDNAYMTSSNIVLITQADTPAAYLSRPFTGIFIKI